jgi:hypothetical protein
MTSLNSDKDCKQIYQKFVLLYKEDIGYICLSNLSQFRLLDSSQYEKSKHSDADTDKAYNDAAIPLVKLLKTFDEMEFLAGARTLPVHSSCPAWGCEVCAKTKTCARLSASNQHPSE